MSILEKWFGGSENEPKQEEKPGKKFEVSPKEAARVLSSFIGLNVGEEFVLAVLEKAHLSEEESMAMYSAANNQMPDNGLSVSANMAYLSSLRSKIRVIVDEMDVGAV